jgi:hypothetical protein
MNLVRFLGPQTEVLNLHRSLRYWEYMIPLRTKIREPFGGLGDFAVRAILTVVNCHVVCIIESLTIFVRQLEVSLLLHSRADNNPPVQFCPIVGLDRYHPLQGS